MEKKLSLAICDQTARVLWELKNAIDCIPDDLWCREYCEMPLYKHVYHTLHSLDLWYINPFDKDYTEPEIHIDNLNNLDIATDRLITRAEILSYYSKIKIKITAYTNSLNDTQLIEKPQDCPYTKFELILGQFRHLHTHLGMIMGFIIEATGQWPTVLGMTSPIPSDDNYSKFC